MSALFIVIVGRRTIFDAMSRSVLSSSVDNVARIRRRHFGQSTGLLLRSSPRSSETSANDWKQMSDSQKNRLR
jgi:hypothetical protein